MLPFCSLTWGREPTGHVRAQAGSDCVLHDLNRPRPKGHTRWRDGLLIANRSRLEGGGVGPRAVCLSRAQSANNFLFFRKSLSHPDNSDGFTVLEQHGTTLQRDHVAGTPAYSGYAGVFYFLKKPQQIFCKLPKHTASFIVSP